MNRRFYIATVTIAYAVGALLWIYLSDRFIESIGGSIGFTVFSTLKGFVFVVVTTALLYLALHTAAAGTEREQPNLTLRRWVFFAFLSLLLLPAGFVSYAVFRSASNMLLGERRGQLELMAEAVARSIDAEVSLRMVDVPPQAPQATLRAIVTEGNAGFSRLLAFAGLIGDSARVLIVTKDGGGDGRWMITGRQQALPEALAPLATAGAAGLAADVITPEGGEPLLVAAAMIPAANAVLIASIATADAVNEVRDVAFLSAITAAACLVVAGALTQLFVQRQRLRTALVEADQNAALHAAEERFRATFEQAADGIAHLDLDGRFLRVNETLCALLGYGREDLLGRSYADMRPDIRARGAGAADLAAIAALPAGTVIEPRSDQPHLTSTGGEIWLSCVLSIARDTPQDAGYIILMASDATPRRAAEHRLMLAQAVFTNTQEGLVVTDLTGRITAVNPAFVAITGHAEAEVLGENMRFLHSGRHDRLFYQLLWTALKNTGVWRGEIWNRSKDGTLYLQQTVISTVYGPTGAPESYVGALNDITQARHSEIEVDRLTRYDPLTGLPNRTLIFSLIEHQLTRTDTQCAVLYIDIEHLKIINDSLGFAAGDEVLSAAAQNLRKTVPEDATIGRYGADEFVVLIDCAGPKEAVSLADRLIDALGVPFAAEGVSNLFINVSIGISLYPADASDAETLLQHAHSALYQAKGRGGQTYAFYTDALTRDARARLELVANLRRALAEHEFTVHYQPIVRLEDQTIVGAEALVRWVTPEGEIISPDRFIPIAEETGLIIPLGDFVLATACAQMARWRKAGLPCAFIAVNISAGQLNAIDICAKTEAAFAAAGVPADSIEFEITESMLFGADSGAESKLKRIAELGARIAIDDFGTGYSSLAYLKRFPISRLKIDQSFVRDLPASTVDGELVRAMIAMARALDIEILAEGVEEAGQMAFLAANGCTFGQGYFWSRPLPPERFEALFSNASQAPGALAGTR